MRRRRLWVTAFVAVVLLIVAGRWGLHDVGPARGQVNLSIDPAMVKGARGARVTIIEFSDYQ